MMVAAYVHHGYKTWIMPDFELNNKEFLTDLTRALLEGRGFPGTSMFLDDDNELYHEKMITND